MLELSLGSVFAHRFVVEKRMESGGMGLIFRSRDRQTNRPIALKLLQRKSNRMEVDRFMTEARILSELRHPAIVAYVAHGISSEGQAYLAMEWLEGEDLAHRLRRLRMNVPEALILLRAVASALQVAHQAGLVHRDLKPSNLFLRNGQIEQVTLIDFGLAQRSLGSQETQTGAVVGTPEYMAPEQARGDSQVGPSADIFSLGCVLYESLTGQPPFVSEHIAAVLAKILFEEAPPLHEVQPEIPSALSRLVARMLVKNAQARIQDASELLTELDALGELPFDPKSIRIGSTGGDFEMAGIEQALVSVVIAQAREARADDRTERITLDPVQGASTQNQNASVRDALLLLGVTVECMIDGSLIATIVRQGAATDQAIHAARCALLIKERWPDSVVALATGRAVLDGNAILGEVLGRVGMMLDNEQNSANRSAVRVDETTARLVESYFAVSRPSSDELFLTGLAQPGEETQPLLGMPTQCVGRERELNLLDTCFAGCIENSAAAAVLVSSPPGVGKSRVRHEFLRRIKGQEQEVLILVGRGDPMTGGASYGLLAQALRRLFGIVDKEDLTVSQNKILTRVGQSVPSADVQHIAEFLGEMCGTSFPESVLLHAARQEPRIMGDQVAQAFIDFLSAECSKHPVVLLLEDLHWGDALTVKLVDNALRDLSDRPLMVLALARPEIEELFPKLWMDRARQDIRLGGLSKRACERLIRQVLGESISPQVVARITEQAAGNALFLEELVRAVAEGKGEELPETVLAILHARLMRLQPEVRRILRTASVFGETCWAGGLRRLLGYERTIDQFESWMQILVESEILEQHKESRLPGETEYGFRHGLVREAAYGMLPDDERQRGHYLVGCYLEERGQSDPSVLAEHFQRSGDLERAIVLYTRAAEKAYENNDLVGAHTQADKGLNCGAEGETRGALNALKAAAWFWSNELVGTFRVGNEALELLATGTVDWCRALIFTTGAAAALGKSAEVSDLALRFGTITPVPEILGTYMIGASILAMMLGFVGDREMSKLFLSHLKEIGEPLEANDPHTRACMHYALGRCTTGWPAVEHFRITSEAYQIIGDRRMIIISLADLGFALARLGDSAGGEAKLRQVLPLAVRLEDPITLTWVQMYLALVLAERSDAESRAEAKQIAQKILLTIGESSYYSGIAHCALAAVYRAEGNLVQAEDDAHKAMETLQRIPSNAPMAFIALGRVYFDMQRYADAAKVASDGAELIGNLKVVSSSEVPLRMLLVESLRRAGDQERVAREQVLLDELISFRVQEIREQELRLMYEARLLLHDGAAPLF